VQNLAFAKSNNLIPLYDGQDFPFGFFIRPVLCRRQALVKVLTAMPFPMLPEVVAFLFADFKP
jgi:hypothetical protein